MTDPITRLGGQARDSDALELATRVGLVTYGVVHLLIAWLALQLALGENEGRPSTDGALRQVAEQSFGVVLLWAIAVGMAALVVWRLLEAVRGDQSEEGAKRWASRAAAVLKAVIYGYIGFSAAQFAVGSGGGGGGSDTLTARVMRLPAGPWIVGLVGVAILGYGGYQIRKGWTEKFREDLGAEGTSGRTGTAYVAFGKAGYTAKGVAILVVGGLFCYAALTRDAGASGGLDAALLEVLQAPAGPFLLGAIAVGIGCFGLFCFAQARHLSQ